MNKKKILILSMSCRDEFFGTEVAIIKRTWASDLPEHIRYMYYDGCWENNMLCGDHLCVCCEDDSPRTWRKTYYAFVYLYNNGLLDEYDYVFRTNTSTYVNVPLLDALVQDGTVFIDGILYSSDIISLPEACVPYPNTLYGRGNGLLFNTGLLKDLIMAGYDVSYQDGFDDVWMGFVLNRMHIKDDMSEYLYGLPHGWYKCLGEDIPVDTLPPSGHTLCRTFGEDFDPTVHPNLLTIQLRRYEISEGGGRDTEGELIAYEKLHVLMTEHHHCTDMHKASAYISGSPDVFVGSILGYISRDNWRHLMDTHELPYIQMTNKAINDENRNRYMTYLNSITPCPKD